MTAQQQLDLTLFKSATYTQGTDESVNSGAGGSWFHSTYHGAMPIEDGQEDTDATTNVGTESFFIFK